MLHYVVYLFFALRTVYYALGYCKGCKLPFAMLGMVASCLKRALVWGTVVRGFAHRDLC